MEGGAQEERQRYGVWRLKEGGPLVCVAKAKDGVHPHISHLPCSPTPAFAGTVDDFIAKHNNDPALLRQMKNKVHVDYY